MKYLLKYLLALFLLTGLQESKAGSSDFLKKKVEPQCKDINLYEIENSPFNKIPIERQWSGTCYAYAAGQLLSYELISNGQSSQDISPLWIAYVASRAEINKKSITGGFPDKSLAALAKIGVCPKSVLQDAIHPYLPHVDREDLLSWLEWILGAYEKNIKNANKCLISPAELIPSNSRTCNTSVSTSLVANFVDDFQEILANYNYLPILDKIFSVCEQHMKKVEVPELKQDLTYFMHPIKFMKSVTTSLVERREPISVSFCAEILTTPSFKFLPNKDCAHHAALIVGQRSINGSCQFLIRDSNPIQNAESLESSQQNPWPLYYNKTNVAQGIWVDAERFREATYLLIQK